MSEILQHQTCFLTVARSSQPQREQNPTHPHTHSKSTAHESQHGLNTSKHRGYQWEMVKAAFIWGRYCWFQWLEQRGERYKYNLLRIVITKYGTSAINANGCKLMEKFHLPCFCEYNSFVLSQTSAVHSEELLQHDLHILAFRWRCRSSFHNSLGNVLLLLLTNIR